MKLDSWYNILRFLYVVYSDNTCEYGNALQFYIKYKSLIFLLVYRLTCFLVVITIGYVFFMA